MTTDRSVEERPAALVPVAFVDEDDRRQLLAVLGWYPCGGVTPSKAGLDRTLVRFANTPDASTPRSELRSVEVGGHDRVRTTRAATTQDLGLLFADTFAQVIPELAVLVLITRSRYDTVESKDARKWFCRHVKQKQNSLSDEYRLDSSGLLTYNNQLSEAAEREFSHYWTSPLEATSPVRLAGTRSKGQVSPSAVVRDLRKTLPDRLKNTKVSGDNNVAEVDPSVVANEIVDTVVEQLEAVSDPLGRIAVISELADELLSKVYDEGYRSALEYLEQGGTWTQIGQSLGVSRQAIQQRLDPRLREARKRRPAGE